MKTKTLRNLSLSALACGGGALAFALPGSMEPQNATKLARVQFPDKTNEGFCADDWRARIAGSDLDQREQDFAKLVQLARRDPAVREEVQEWAREGDGELAWTARLILREVERRPGLGGANAFMLPDGLDLFSGSDLSGLMEDMHDFTWRFPGGRALQMLPDPQALSGGGAAKSESKQFSLQVGPDGVICKIIEDVDGEKQEKEWKADSLEQLLLDHPELQDRIGTGDAGSVFHWLTPGSVRLRGLGQFDGWNGLLYSPDSASPRTDILGVFVHPLDASEAPRYGLEAGVGLVVERTQPGSMAEALGIQRGHVLVELNGRALKSSDDLTDMLAARGESAEVKVELIDRWGQQRTRIWKPDGSTAPRKVPVPEQAARDV